jgi:hypothetical protein
MDPISLPGVDKEVVRTVAEGILILVGIPVYLVSCKVIMKREGILIKRLRINKRSKITCVSV